ncbi:hypothetical protein [Microbispora bryophytorum]|uniref:hypothetical protein n=1 Tax=Microbispora bryophytorum TaxID=1460882 RepID=UPI001430B876|nr:hypothetical protein [Microbispora bryophytorum]MBD3139847.1 hypothetical protein [Microbispora bryophytorum]
MQVRVPQCGGRRLQPINSMPVNSMPVNSMPVNSMPVNSMPINSTEDRLQHAGAGLPRRNR